MTCYGLTIPCNNISAIAYGMRHVVEKYEGSLHIDVGAKQFSLSILLRLPKEDKHGL